MQMYERWGHRSYSEVFQDRISIALSRGIAHYTIEFRLNFHFNNAITLPLAFSFLLQNDQTQRRGRESPADIDSPADCEFMSCVVVSCVVRNRIESENLSRE